MKPPITLSGPHRKRKTRPVVWGFWRRFYADLIRFLFARSLF